MAALARISPMAGGPGEPLLFLPDFWWACCRRSCVGGALVGGVSADRALREQHLDQRSSTKPSRSIVRRRWGGMLANLRQQLLFILVPIVAICSSRICLVGLIYPDGEKSGGLA